MEGQAPTCCRAAANHRRLCVYCGFAGLSIQAGGDLTGYRCPACKGDLYARPPRSYLEMEGFVAVPAPGRAPVNGWRGVVLRALRLWTRIASRWKRPLVQLDPEPAPWDTAGPPRPSRIHDQRGARRRMTGSRDENTN